MSSHVQTVRGAVPSEHLGPVLMHEHIFIRSQELERNIRLPEYDLENHIDAAASGLRHLLTRGIKTLVDVTVLGLGRDIEAIIAVNARVPEFNIVAATGYYTFTDLPSYFHNHGPGLMIDRPDPLHAMFVREITQGIAGTKVRAGIIKISTDAPGFTKDVTRVWENAAKAHLDTGVPITTHSNASKRGGLEQQDFLKRSGVDLNRTIIGHCGDSNDLAYLQALMDAGSFIGMDRFGLKWFADERQRTDIVAQLCRKGYAERMTLSHDAAYYSINSEPSYRKRALPEWHHAHISDTVIPQLMAQGVTEAQIEQMMVINPKRVLSI